MLNTITNEAGNALKMAHSLHSNHDHPVKTEPKDYQEAYDSKSANSIANSNFRLLLLASPSREL